MTIRYVKVSNEFEGNEGDGWAVGYQGVTKIDLTEKPGEYCMIPYIRVWKGDFLFAEYCQHKCVGVEYLPEST
jgi:hypothetical protein